MPSSTFKPLLRRTYGVDNCLPYFLIHFFNDIIYIGIIPGCCKLAGVDFRKWTTYFLTHIHEYDNDYSKDLADFLPLRLRERREFCNLPLKFL